MSAASTPSTRKWTLKRIVISVPRRLFSHVQSAAANIASRNGFLSSLYFTFLSTRFYREHQAVLAGRREFLARCVGDKTSSGGFRRNIHRLEKALIMRPRRRIFAEAYIAETVQQFVAATNANSRIDQHERRWAGDVLSAYFAAVDDTQVTAKARLAFTATGYEPTVGEAGWIPYEKDKITPSKIPFDQLRSLFVERRSVRWFEDKLVPANKLERAVEAAGWAPSACNRQPYRFHACIDPAKAAGVASLAGGTAGFAHNIPCLIVVIGDMSNYVEERDRHLIYIDGALASMQLMLALQCLGLATVPINWPDVSEREEAMARTLGLEPHERPVMLIGVGYPLDDGLIPYSQKKPTSILLHIEE